VNSDASDGRQTKVGDAGSPVLVDQYVRLRRSLGCKYEGNSFGSNETHSFQVSVYHAEVVHVLQAIRDASQLNSSISNAGKSSDNVQARCGLYVDPAQ